MDELDQILEFFIESHQRDQRSLSMNVVVTYVLFSARRQDELTLIPLDDFDEVDLKQMVRKMKHPGQKKANGVLCDVPQKAVRAMHFQSNRKGRIFLYNAHTVSRRFTHACKFLEIEDLHFHDLRHEAISRLIEMGSTIA